MWTKGLSGKPLAAGQIEVRPHRVEIIKGIAAWSCDGWAAAVLIARRRSFTSASPAIGHQLGMVNP
jgi:hypothetical protein